MSITDMLAKKAAAAASAANNQATGMQSSASEVKVTEAAPSENAPVSAVVAPATAEAGEFTGHYAATNLRRMQVGNGWVYPVNGVYVPRSAEEAVQLEHHAKNGRVERIYKKLES